MKIIYIANTRIPTKKAHGYQICKMCEEFSSLGADIELWLPSRKNSIKENAYIFYDLKNNFKINIIKSFDFLILEKYFGNFSFYLQKINFLIKLAFKKIPNDAIIYSRDPEIIWISNIKRKKTVYDAHNWPNSKNWLLKIFLSKVDKIVCNSKGTENKYKKNGFKETKAAPNGVDLEKFNIQKNKEELREELGLPMDKKLIMYVGALYKWKGIETIINAASIEKEKNILFTLIGGDEESVKKYQNFTKKNNLTNIKFLGYQKKEKIPLYLKSADILLLPNLPISNEGEFYTSPIKMFEYMASQIPIIASDIPAIREILNKNNAFLIKPGDEDGLKKAIKTILENWELNFKITQNSFNIVKKYTWSRRAQKILNFIANKQLQQ